MEIFKDGINADIRAIDYKHESIEVEGGEIMNISLASGGGWVAKISVLQFHMDWIENDMFSS